MTTDRVTGTKVTTSPEVANPSRLAPVAEGMNDPGPTLDCAREKCWLSSRLSRSGQEPVQALPGVANHFRRALKFAERAG